MFLILLKALISFTVFGGIYFTITRLAEEMEKSKKEEGVYRKRKLFDIDELLSVFDTAPKSQKAKNLKLISAGFCLLMFFLWLQKIFLAGAAGITGYFLPQFIANLRKERKARRLDDQLADGLVLIANSLKAGMSFPQTIGVMARQGSPPLSLEFNEVAGEEKLGVSMDKALVNLASRWPKVVNLQIAVIAINIAQEVGGNLAETLSRLSDTMRKRKEIQGKIDSLTTQGKISGIITALTPFALFAAISWMSPEMMAPMISTTLGNIMLIVIVFLIMAGFLIIRKIVDIDI